MGRFRDEDCTCQHPSWMHDDGFGCTDEGCGCLASWDIERDED